MNTDSEVTVRIKTLRTVKMFEKMRKKIADSDVNCTIILTLNASKKAEKYIFEYFSIRKYYRILRSMFKREKKL